MINFEEAWENAETDYSPRVGDTLITRMGTYKVQVVTSTDHCHCGPYTRRWKKYVEDIPDDENLERDPWMNIPDRVFVRQGVDTWKDDKYGDLVLTEDLIGVRL